MPVYIEGNLEGEQQLSRRLLIVSDGVKDWRSPLQNIREELLRSFQLNFDQRGGLFGGWAPAKKDYGHPLMEDSGDLRGGFDGDIHDDFVKLFNSVDYFPYHQSNQPRSKLPRRVMMKIDQERKQFIQKAFQAYLVDLIRRRQ